MHHVVAIAPSSSAGTFDAFVGGVLLVASSAAPCRDAARSLLANGIAGPNDDIVILSARGWELLRGQVGTVARLTVH
jgi:hypothetical protein